MLASVKLLKYLDNVDRDNAIFNKAQKEYKRNWKIICLIKKKPAR